MTSMRRSLTLSLAMLTSLALVSCAPPDPKQELQLSDVEGYWVVDTSLGTTQRISPAIRFTLTNKAAKRPIQATVTFRHKDEPDAEWGGAFLQVATAGKPLQIGERRVVVLIANSHYTTQGAPEELFKHPDFKDPHAELFIRLGSSQWVKMAAVDMERRLGTRTLGEPPRAP